MATFSKLVSSFSLKIFVKVTLVNIVITCFTHYFTNLSVIIYRTHIWINFVKSIQPACMCASVHLLTFSKDFAKVRNALQYISFGKVCQRNRKHASNCFSQSIKKQRCKYIYFFQKRSHKCMLHKFDNASLVYIYICLHMFLSPVFHPW